MSKLAQQIAELPPPSSLPRRGPANACFPLYGDGDLEDWEQIEALRANGYEWRQVQSQVDGLLKIERPLDLERFKYHWRRRCFCWPVDLRR